MTAFDAAKYGPWTLITGASEGTGAEFALRLADEGLNCILVARREGPLAELADQVRARGVNCVVATVDLSQPDATDRIAAAVGDREVGLFIANAGADTNASLFLDNEVANWERLINLNIVTTMRNCHYFGQGMRARGRGGIILVGSGSCYGGLYGMGVYCGVKAFDLCFGEGLWAEMRHVSVDVLNLILGRTDTPAHRRISEANGRPFDATGMASATEVARVGLEQLPHGPVYNWGQANDVAGYAPNSPDERRARIERIEAMSAQYLKSGDMTDREAITDLIYRYCRAMDRIDRAQGYAIWHADGSADYGEAVYQGSGRGFVDQVCEQHARLLRHSHQVTNIVIELDGDRAGSESYYTTALRMIHDETPHEIRVWGRYIDTWSKRDGRWGIDHRIAIRDFDDIRAVTPMSDDARSRRDRDDPSYAVLT